MQLPAFVHESRASAATVVHYVLQIASWLVFMIDAQAAALEARLFPGESGDVDDFGREGEQDADLQAVTELVRQV